MKPHASPVLHAMNYLLGDLDAGYLPTPRAKGGLQSYPSRPEDPDIVDFSTGSVDRCHGTAAGRHVPPLFARADSGGRDCRPVHQPARRCQAGRGRRLGGVAEPAVAALGELLWVVDFNRQSLDRVVPDIQTARLAGMFEAAGWQVVTLKWGRRISALFERPGCEHLRQHLESMPNEEYQRMLRVDPSEVAGRILSDQGSDALRALVTDLPAEELAAAVRDLGAHDLDLLTHTFDTVDPRRPAVVFAYTVKGRGLGTRAPRPPLALLSETQMQDLARATGASLDDPWQPFPAGTPADDLCRGRREELRHRRARSHRPRAPSPQADVDPDRVRTHPRPICPASSGGRRARGDVQPDVASSTHLGGWINKTGVWSVRDRRDWSPTTASGSCAGPRAARGSTSSWTSPKSTSWACSVSPAPPGAGGVSG